MPSSRVARRTLSRSCSNPNSGQWAPTTTSPRSRYLSAQALTYGSVRSQLTHEYVQMSTRTTRPRSSSAFSGSEFSQTGALSSAERSLWVRLVMDTWSSYVVLTVLMSPRPGERGDEHEDHDEPA